MLSPEEQIARSGLRRKYAAGRPSTAAVMQYGQQEVSMPFWFREMDQTWPIIMVISGELSSYFLRSSHSSRSSRSWGERFEVN